MAIIRSNHMHSTGIITLAIDKSLTDKESIFACSSDETFGTWKCSPKGEFSIDIQNCSGNCQGAVAVYGEDIYVGEAKRDPITDNKRHVVVKYSRNSFLSSSPILTFTLEVTSITCSKNYLIAGSNDFNVKCLPLEQSNKPFDRYECEQAVVHLSISPNEQFFTISTADGFIQIRPISKPSNTNPSSKKPLGKFNVVHPFKHITAESPRMECCWSAKSTRLFVPARAGVVVISSDEWKQERTITHPDLKNATLSVVTISNDNQLIAGCTLEGSIFVWAFNYDDFPLRLSMKKTMQGIGNLTSVLFNPINDKMLILGYSDGYLCAVTDPIPQVGENPDSDNYSKRNNQIFGVDDDVLEENDDAIAETDETDIGAIKSQFGFDDFGVHVSERTAQNGMLPALTEQQRLMLEHPCTTIKGMKTPKSFGVGSTPMHNSHRYIVYNIHGIIKSYRTGDDNTIEISFHDSSIHSEIVIDNTSTNYVLGDINTNLVALASQKTANKESELLVYHLTAWDIDSRQWTQKMNSYEIIDSLCVGVNFVAVFTSSRYLRLFTMTGTQRIVVSLPGTLLTMCAFQCELVMAQATGGVLVHDDDEYEHQISASVYEVDILAPGVCFHFVRTIPLAFGPDVGVTSPLRWMSHSSSGQLVAMDAEYTVRLFNAPRSLWFPIVIGSAILKEPEVDSLWPIAVIDAPDAQFRYSYCRGTRYPQTTRALVPTTIAWTLPVLNSDTDRGKHEGDLLVTELQQSILRLQKQFQPNSQQLTQQLNKLSQNYLANVIKLFAVSCQSGRECRAAELTYRATAEQGIQAMCTYASKKQRLHLSEKVAEIGRERVNNGLNNDPKFPSNENKGTPFKNFSHSLVLSQQTNSSQSSSYIPERFQMDTRIVLPKRKVPTTVRPKIVDLPPLSDITKAQNESEDTRDIPMFLVDALKSNSRTAVDSKSVSRCKKDDEANEGANEDLDTSVDNNKANTTSGSLNESALNAFLSNNPANDSSMFLSDSFLSPANKSPAVGNPFKRAKTTVAKGVKDSETDFFESLSVAQNSKLADLVASKKPKRRNAKNSGDATKKQSTLSSFTVSTASSAVSEPAADSSILTSAEDNHVIDNDNNGIVVSDEE